MVGTNIRLRRKKLRLSQQDLACGDWTRSYISQIESGRIQPPMDTLAKIAVKLDTSVSNLMGDEILLQKAKAAILYPDICRIYLGQLPETPTTVFLCELTNSLLTNKSLHCQLPPNAELYFLTARVLIFQQNYPQAIGVLQSGIKYFDEFWQIIFLTKLYTLYQHEKNIAAAKDTQQKLAAILNNNLSLSELQYKLIHELQVEPNPVRCLHLLGFIQALDYSPELTQAFEIANSTVL